MGAAVALGLLNAVWGGFGALLWPGLGNPQAAPLQILGAALTDLPQYNVVWRVQPHHVYAAARTTGGNVFICFSGFKVNEDYSYAAREYYLANLVLYPQRAWVYPGESVLNTGQDILAAYAQPATAANAPIVSQRPPADWLSDHNVRVLITVIRTNGNLNRTYERVPRLPARQP